MSKPICGEPCPAKDWTDNKPCLCELPKGHKVHKSKACQHAWTRTGQTVTWVDWKEE